MKKPVPQMIRKEATPATGSSHQHKSNQKQQRINLRRGKRRRAQLRQRRRQPLLSRTSHILMMSILIK
ncbi:uncharacterized protein MELLADRAFT_94982 [Melampsora larici-populina 98AG31]|uniref:Uncharacterized protein n=1 Tax=Melampsora larici-populina (strain 98AG31 / pathotype 3-4-7) TaxID=747676 RepID=F4S8N9_MELLP|nr:uncharacterized protein MELLADRAFT_94982 [Melampsora larici-populina 98AG31]EGF98929.1 hypothetical protein MELLADRAFT_94982 [Melampsora larici-populina 98AG31]